MPVWTQNYDPFNSLAISAPVAALPLFLLFYLLAIRRSPGYRAAAICCLAAFLIAGFLWKMPWPTAFSSLTMGMVFGLFPIVWVIVNAVWMYNLTVESGEFETIKKSLAGLTEDRRLQTILIAFAFSCFLEGSSGFGTPVAIAAAMLVGLGFNPFYAAGLCLVANSASAAFGGIGIAILVGADVSGLDPWPLGTAVALHLSILSFFLPLWLSCIVCGFKKSMEVWPALFIGGLSYSLAMYLIARFYGPYLTGIASSLIAMSALIVLFKVWRPKEIWRFEGEGPTVTGETEKVGPGRVIRAWLPYLIMTIFVFICSDARYKTLVGSLEFDLLWPGLHERVLKTLPIVTEPTNYQAVFRFNPVSSVGSAIFLAGLLASLTIPGYGPLKALGCLKRTFIQLRYSILTICLVLSLAYVMNYSGMSSTLGLAFTHTGFLFPFFAPMIGWIGVFLTGSDTSANALFGSLEHTTGEALGLDPNLMVAAASTGGVTGKMISPQSISIATAATGQVGREGDLFRFALKHSLVMLLIVCLMMFVHATWLN